MKSKILCTDTGNLVLPKACIPINNNFNSKNINYNFYSWKHFLRIYFLKIFISFQASIRCIQFQKVPTHIIYWVVEIWSIIIIILKHCNIITFIIFYCCILVYLIDWLIDWFVTSCRNKRSVSLLKYHIFITWQGF